MTEDISPQVNCPEVMRWPAENVSGVDRNQFKNRRG